MSIKFNLTGHKKLWNWLAEHPRNSKGDYFEIVGIQKDDVPFGECYACDYMKNTTDDCSGCPLDTSLSTWCLNGLYDEWEEAQDMFLFALTIEDENAARERVKELALKIANLPVREGVECE